MMKLFKKLNVMKRKERREKLMNDIQHRNAISIQEELIRQANQAELIRQAEQAASLSMSGCMNPFMFG